MLLPKIKRQKKTFYHNYIQTSRNMYTESLSYSNKSINISNQLNSNFNNKSDKLYSEENIKQNNLNEPKFPYKPQPKIKDTRLIKTKFKSRNSILYNDFIKMDFTTSEQINSNFSTQINFDLDTLLLKKSIKQNENKNEVIKNINNMNSNIKNLNIEDFRKFISMKNDKEKMRDLSSKILENYKKLKNENEISNLKITNNTYFDNIINRIIRKVIYFNNKNGEIKKDYVMNMLIDEGNKLEFQTNLKMELNCKIKNFSSVILENDYKKTLIPIINSFYPLSYNEIMNINESIYKTQIDKKDEKKIKEKNNYFHINIISNKNIGDMKNLNNNIQYNENEIEKKDENNNLNEEGKNKRGIWNIFNEEQNKKKRKSLIRDFALNLNINNNSNYNNNNYHYYSQDKNQINKFNNNINEYDFNNKINNNNSFFNTYYQSKNFENQFKENINMFNNKKFDSTNYDNIKTNESISSENSLINIHSINKDRKKIKNINYDIQNILNEENYINKQNYKKFDIQKIKKDKINLLKKNNIYIEKDKNLSKRKSSRNQKSKDKNISSSKETSKEKINNKKKKKKLKIKITDIKEENVIENENDIQNEYENEK